MATAAEKLQNVRLPNGNIVQNVPASVTKEQIQSIAIKNGLAKESDFTAEAPAETKEEKGYFANVGSGALERSFEVVGNLTEMAGDTVEGGANWLGNKIAGTTDKPFSIDLPFTDKKFTDKSVSGVIKPITDELRDADFGYEARHTWEKLKADPSLLGLMQYSGEQMGKSLPDMIAVMSVTGLYALARIEEMGDTRAVNAAMSKLPKDASKAQVEEALLAEANLLEKTYAAPFAVGSIALERLGLHKLLNPGKVVGVGGAAKVVGGSILLQGGIEAFQEGGIEYAGETLGTGKDYSGFEAADRGAAGFFAGAPFGGAATAATLPLNYNKDIGHTASPAELAKADAVQVKNEASIKANTEVKSAPEQTIESAKDNLSTSEAAILSGVHFSEINNAITEGTLPKNEDGTIAKSDLVSLYSLKDKPKDPPEDPPLPPAAAGGAVLAPKPKQDNEQDNVLSVASYYETEGARELAHNVKKGDPEAIKTMATQMASLIPEGAVLVPIPSRTGKATVTLDLANAIAEQTGSTVSDVLRGKERKSSYDAKKEGSSLSEEELAMEKIGEVPEGTVVLIDNVMASGATAKSASSHFNKPIVAVHSIDKGAMEKTKTEDKSALESRSIEAVMENDGFVGPKPTPEQLAKPQNPDPIHDKNKTKAVAVNAFGQVYSQGEIESEIAQRRKELEEDNPTPGTEEVVLESNNAGGYIPLIMENVPLIPQQTRLSQNKTTRKNLGKRGHHVTYNMVYRGFKKIIGNRIYHGGMKRRGALGFYNLATGQVRIKERKNPEVLAHEVAHYLDFHPSTKVKFQNWYKGNPAVRRFSYTPEPSLIDSEGFAEFVRLWTSQYPKLLAAEPKAVAEFENILKQDFGLWRSMLEMQELTTSYYAQGAESQARGKIGDKKSITEELDEFAENNTPDLIRQKLQDSRHAARVVGQVVFGENYYNMSATKDPYWLSQLANGGAESIYIYVKEYGTIGIDEITGEFKRTGISLDEVFTSVKKVKTKKRETWEDFILYMVARRAAELMAQGRERHMNARNIAAGLALKDKHPDADFEGTFEKFQRFQDRMLDFYVQSGYIKPEQRDSFQESNKDYVDFHRIRENLLSVKDGRGPIHSRLKGEVKNIRDIEENIVNGLQANISIALEARARRAIFEAIATSKDGALFASKVPKQAEVATVKPMVMAQRVAVILDGLGVGIDLVKGALINAQTNDDITTVDEMALYLSENPGLLAMFTGMVEPRTDDTLVQTIIGRNGIEQHWEVHEPLLIDMFLNLGPKSYGLGWEVAFDIKNVLTRTVTQFLEFLVANGVRDTLHSAEVSQYGFKPFYTTIVGMAHYLSKSEAYQEAVMNGFLFSGKLHANTKEGRVRSRLDVPSREGLIGITDDMEKMLATYDNIVSSTEYGSRLGEYILARNAGENASTAAKSARNLSGDFSISGNSDFARTYIRSIPFFNASVVGMTRTAQAFKAESDLYKEMIRKGKVDKEATLKYMASFEFAKRSFAMKTMPFVVGSLILAAQNEDDERYKALTDHEKNRWWHLYYNKDLPALKMLKPHDLGLLFGTVPELMFKYVRDQEGDEFADAMTVAFATQLGFFTDAPGVLQSYLEDLRNETWTGAPIISMENQVYTGDQTMFQYTDQTPELYRKLGAQFKVSPDRLRHYTKGMFRTLEAYVNDAAQFMMWDEEAMGERPFMSSPLHRIANNFVGKDVTYRTKWTEEYWELYESSKSLHAAQKKIVDTDARRYNKKDMDVKYLSEKYPEYRAAGLAIGAAEKTLAKASEVSKRISEALLLTQSDNRKNPDGTFVMKAKDKEAKMNEYYEIRNNAFKEYYQQTKVAIELYEIEAAKAKIKEEKYKRK